MAYERLSDNSLDYHLCRYGQSKMLFRGPKKNLKVPYLTFVGGTETYGKYIEKPFPALVEDAVGKPAVNFGAINAGVDAFVKDPSLIEICSGSEMTVIQIMGAHNMSNRFYSVHPRRNDRFVKASSLLQTFFREVDFTEFTFTRHMLMTLKTLSPEKFRAVETELKEAWSARMGHMLANIDGPKMLLWIRDSRQTLSADESELGQDPVFVEDEMVEALRPKVKDIIEVEVTSGMNVQCTEEMKFAALEAASAEEMYGTSVHQHIADTLVSHLD